MDIYITGKTNKDYLAIDSAEFKLPSGTILTIRRAVTEYSISENGDLEMKWEDCYILAVDGYYIFETPDYGEVEFSDVAAMEFSKIPFANVEAVLDDDEAADADYSVDISSVVINGREVFRKA